MPEKIPEPLLARFSEFVTARMGLHFPPEKRRDLERNMKPVAAEFGFKNVTDCIRRLLSSELTRGQMDTLASHLTIGETYFFRGRQLFEMLEQKIVPEWTGARRETDRRLRIWSAGCCTGEEPYSIAILLSKAIPDWKQWNITILGTDMNPGFLRKASDGIYNEWSFRDTPSWVKQSCFKKLDYNRYEILPQFKEMVTFGYLNLAEDVYPSLLNNTNAMDAIFCRNVLMYFSPEQARKVIGHFHGALVDDGRLFVSATETSLVLYRQFAAVNLGGFTFYKKEQRKARMGSTGDSPVPSGDSPLGTEKPSKQAVDLGMARVPPVPGGQWPDGAGGAPVLPTDVKSREPAKTPKPSIYDEALGLYEAGEYSSATEKLLADPAASSNAKTAALLARAFANQGNLTEALRWCDKAIAADKMNPELHYLRAIILQEQRALDGSVAALKRALYLDPQFVLAHFALGNLALQRENFGEADKQFQNAIALLKHFSPEKVLPGSEGLTAGRLREIILATMLQEKSA